MLNPVKSESLFFYRNFYLSSAPSRVYHVGKNQSTQPYFSRSEQQEEVIDVKSMFHVTSDHTMCLVQQAICPIVRYFVYQVY